MWNSLSQQIRTHRQTDKHRFENNFTDDANWLFCAEWCYNHRNVTQVTNINTLPVISGRYYAISFPPGELPFIRLRLHFIESLSVSKNLRCDFIFNSLSRKLLIFCYVHEWWVGFRPPRTKELNKSNGNEKNTTLAENAGKGNVEL